MTGSTELVSALLIVSELLAEQERRWLKFQKASLESGSAGPGPTADSNSSLVLGVFLDFVAAQRARPDRRDFGLRSISEAPTSTG